MEGGCVAAERRAVDDVAAAILDGTPVDWEAAQSTGNGTDRELIPFLRMVARIADAHRSGDTNPPPVSPERTRPPLRLIAPVEPDATADLGIETWGHLRLLEPIGSGAFGQVYRAWDSRLDRQVALKLVAATAPAEEGTTVIQEGSLLARIRHPNVVTVYGADQFGGRTGLWMELIKGRTLADVVAHQGPMGAQEAALTGLSVCRALSAVHHAGLVHRDIKAANVMREDGGRIVLMDFGTGRAAANVPGRPRATLAGTPLYLAPELFGGADPTVRSDIYSVGVLVFHLATRAYPVTGGSLRELQEAHHQAQPKFLRDMRPDLPDAFVRAVERALDPDPARRFQTAGAMESALAAVVAPELGTTAPTVPLPAERPRPARWTVAAALLAVLCAAGVGTAWLGRAGSGSGGASGSQPPVTQPLALASSVLVRKVAIPDGRSTGRPSPDGRFFSYVDLDGNLAVVELATGSLRRLTAAEPNSAEFALGSAFSADGSLIAYAWHALDGRYELRVIGSDGKRARVLLRRDDVIFTHPYEWSPDGQHVLCDLTDPEGLHRLARVPLEDGAASTVAETGTTAVRHAGFSPDGTLVVYDGPRSDRDPSRDLLVINADGSQRRTLVDHPSFDHSPVFTPDGTRVLFTSDRSGANDVWGVDVSGGSATSAPKLVQRGVGRMNLLGLTRDGRYYYQEIAGAVDVYTAEIGSSRLEQPTPVGTTFAGSNISSAWSPDGRRLAFASRRGPAGFDQRSTTLVIRDPESGDIREHVPALGAFLVSDWSPDGRRVLLWGSDLRGRSGVFEVEADTGRTSTLVVAPPIEDDVAIGRALWMPDGKRLLYRRDRALRIRDVDSGSDEVVLDFRTEKIDGVNGGPLGRGYVPSPDGQALAFSAFVPGAQSLRVKVGTEPSRELLRVTPPESVVLQDWMPDGRSLLVTRGKQGMPPVLVRVPLDGGAPIPLPLGTGLRDASVDPDGRRLTYTSGAPLLEVWVMENFLR
jgi:Tol biopolymer transport system component